MKHCSVIDSPFILHTSTDIKMFNETDDTDSREPPAHTDDFCFWKARREDRSVQVQEMSEYT